MYVKGNRYCVGFIWIRGRSVSNGEWPTCSPSSQELAQDNQSFSPESSRPLRLPGALSQTDKQVTSAVSLLLSSSRRTSCRATWLTPTPEWMRLSWRTFTWTAMLRKLQEGPGKDRTGCLLTLRKKGNVFCHWIYFKFQCLVLDTVPLLNQRFCVFQTVYIRFGWSLKEWILISSTRKGYLLHYQLSYRRKW